MFIRLPLFLLPFVSASTVFAASIEAPIAEVTVYPDRAVVTRSGSGSLPGGIGEVTIAGLPHDLVADSLQVSARAGAPLAILDVRSATRYGVPEGMDRLKPLLERQKQLEREIEQVALDLTVLKQQRTFLEKVETSVTAPRTEGDVPSPEDWAGMARFFQESLGELLPRIHEKETTIKEINEKLTAVTQEISQTRGAERTRSREAIIRYEADEATEADFTVSYTMMNAGWTPAYNIRVRSADKDVQLDYQASVRQRTGEDWSGVRLTLSTARPSLGGTPPVLRPWLVDVRPPPVPATRALRQAADYADDLEPRAGERALAQEAVYRDAAVETSLTAVNLRVPVPATIPADGEPHRVGVGTFPLQGDFYYTIVPRLSTHAFLQSRVTHPGPAPILAGRANLFLDGNLIGHSHLPRVESEQEFELPLGVDEAIVVERQLLRRFVDQRGIISKTTRTRFEFLTTITNRRGTAEKVVVKDHLPVSQHDRIKVELIELSGGKPIDDRPGFYEWEIDLRPGAEARIPLTFVVEHPEDMEITGL